MGDYILPVIQKTKSYKSFRFASFNRELSEVTLKKLKHEYNIEDNFKYFPIVVDRNMTIIDGQHRFTVCKNLNLHVYYIIKNTEITPITVRSVNRAGKRHSIADVFQMECKSGNKEALKIKEIGVSLDEKFSLSALISLCLSTTSNGSVREKMESGKYTVNDYENTKELGTAFLKLTNGGGVNTTILNVITSISKLNRISRMEIIKELTKKGLVLTTVMSKTIMVSKAVETYNYRKSKPKRLAIP